MKRLKKEIPCVIVEPEPVNFTCVIVEPEPVNFTCVIVEPKGAGFTCLLIPPKPARHVLYAAHVFKTMYVWGAYKNVDQLWRGTPTCDLSTIVNVHKTALNLGVVTKTKEGRFLVNHEKLLNWKAKNWSFDLSNLRSILNADLTQIKKTAKNFDLIPGISKILLRKI